MSVAMLVPPHLSGEHVDMIRRCWPTMLGWSIDQQTAETLAASLREQITADMVRDQLARPEEERTRLGAFVAALVADAAR